MPHLHVSALDALVIFAYMLILSALWRTVAARYADKPIGQAMAAIF